MCGICGYYGIKDNTTIKIMTKILEHRGPDNFGYFSDGKVSLGHRRLSIIDLSEKGKQPMSNEDGTIWITYNGEIYNFQELRSELEEKGHKFNSNTDTEVIIHAYEEYGKDCLQRFNGMFAFCIYDSNKKKLFLARDRLGKKPLYYYWDGEKFIFASELKSILATEFFEKELNYTSLNYFLSYNYIINPYTPFKNIYKLPPASYIRLENRRLEIGQYWDLDFKEQKNKSKEEYIEELTSLLKDSIKKRQISDVPIGAFLSGGLDSSLVVALMSKINQSPVKTFTIGFENQEFDETHYAEILAKHYNTDHTEFKVDVDCVDVLPQVVWAFDEPYSDPSAIPIYYLNQKAKGKVKVILTGDGGDEFFAGYKRYLPYTLDKYYYKFPRIIRKNLFLSIINGTKHSNKRYNLLKYAQTYISTSDLPEDQRHTERMNWFSSLNGEIFSDFFISKIENVDPFASYRDKITGFNTLSKMQYLDIKSFLCDDILMKSDRMSMAHSIELRAPILDFRIAELASKIPSHYKLNGLKVKHILSETAKPFVPKEIIERKKQGMWMPLNDWLKKDLSDILEKTFISLDKRGLMKKEQLLKILQKHNERKADFSVQLWSLINLEVFLKMYLDEFYESPPKINKLF